MDTAMPEIGLAEKKTGLSLSRCIRDVASGIVAEDRVAKIITGTKYKDEVRWKAAVEKFMAAGGEWAPYPEAPEILKRLRAAGKIVQPLLDKGQKPILPTNGSVWISEEEEEDLQWTTAVPVSAEPPVNAAGPIEIADDPTPVVMKTHDGGDAVGSKGSPVRKSVISGTGTSNKASPTPAPIRTTPLAHDMPPATPKVTGWRKFFTIPSWIRLRSRGQK